MPKLTLPTNKSKPDTSLASKTILLYGPPKIGKSTFASRFPDAIFFECEPGLGELEVYKMATPTWKDLLEGARLLHQGNHSFKTIVIDTLDNAFRACTDYVCKANEIDYEGDLGHGKGWEFVKREWHRVLHALAHLPMGLVMISHRKQVEVESRTGKHTRAQPTLPDRARNVVLPLVDLILYCDVEEERVNGKLNQRRVLRTKPDREWEAGDRTGRLPATVDLDFDAFLKAFTPTTKQPEPSKGS